MQAHTSGPSSAHSSVHSSTHTSGALDPAFGQRAAFPLTGKPKEGKPKNGEEYLLQVRQEALAMARARPLEHQPKSASEPKLDEKEEPPLKRPRISGSELSYDEFSSVYCYQTAKRVYGDFAYPQSVLDLYHKGHAKALEAAAVQVDCDSQATWKAHIAIADPVPLDHVSVFRVLKYLARWGTHKWTAQMAVWAWTVLLRVPSTLTSEEMAILRDVVRSGGVKTDPGKADAGAREAEPLPADETEPADPAENQTKEELCGAFKQVVVEVFGQADLK